MLVATRLRRFTSAVAAMKSKSGAPSSQVMVSRRSVDNSARVSGTWMPGSLASIARNRPMCRASRS